MRILINGASGFLGRAILDECKDSSNEAIALSTRVGSIKDKYLSNSNISCYSYEDVSEFSHDGIDVFINLAYPRDAKDIELGNGYGTLYEHLKVISTWNIPNIINISSQSVYGTSRTNTAKESDPVCLDSVYAMGKYGQELLCDALFNNSTLINVRLASLIGPGFDQRITNRLIDIAISKKALNVLNNGAGYSYLDVRDASAGIISIIMHLDDFESGSHKVYNLGINKAYSLIDISNEIKIILESEYGLKIDISCEPCETKMNTSMMETVLFNSTFEWNPMYSLEDSIRNIVQYKMQFQ